MESKGMFVGDWMSLPMLHLLSKSDTIFTSLQRIDQTSPDQGGAPGVEAEQRYHRVLALYLSALDEYLRSLPLEERSTPAHISEILALVHLLYFPADGMGTAIVAEELLRWINLYKPRPTSEASNAVADITNAENDWTFWDYVFICVLRGLDQTALLALEKLNNHPSHSFRKFLAQTSKLVLSMPRSTQFALEPEFAAQRHAWTLKVQSQFHLLDHTMKQMQDEAQVDSDERNFIQVNLGNLFLVLLGDQEKIMEMSDDWRDALGAWGLYVDPSLKRTDLTSALTAILQHFNLDPTDTVENALVAFARSEPLQGAKYCCQIDPWLAAHLTDLLGRAGVLSQDDTAARELLLTTIHTYADVVLEDQGLWRIAVAYLSSAGDQWRKRMRQILLSVPYEITPSGEEPGADRFKRVEELLRACSEFQMPEESRSICQGVADTLMEQGELGLAVSYSVRAGNATLIRKVVERALVVYYTQGAAQFIALVDQFPQNWLVPAGGGDSMAQFSHSLTFLGAYRDFVRMVSESDEAGAAWSLIQALAARPPQTFWAVLLIDAIPLLEGMCNCYYLICGLMRLGATNERNLICLPNCS